MTFTNVLGINLSDILKPWGPSSSGAAAGAVKVATAGNTTIQSGIEEIPVPGLSVSFASWTPGNALRLAASILCGQIGGDFPLDLLGSFFIRVTIGETQYDVSFDASRILWAIGNPVGGTMNQLQVPLLAVFPIETSGEVIAQVYVVSNTNANISGCLTGDVLAADSVSGALSALVEVPE